MFCVCQTHAVTLRHQLWNNRAKKKEFHSSLPASRPVQDNKLGKLIPCVTHWMTAVIKGDSFFHNQNWQAHRSHVGSYSIWCHTCVIYMFFASDTHRYIISKGQEQEEIKDNRKDGLTWRNRGRRRINPYISLHVSCFPLAGASTEWWSVLLYDRRDLINGRGFFAIELKKQANFYSYIADWSHWGWL